MKKDLLTTNDFSREEILSLFDKSTALKEKRKKGKRKKREMECWEDRREGLRGRSKG